MEGVEGGISLLSSAVVSICCGGDACCETGRLKAESSTQMNITIRSEPRAPPRVIPSDLPKPRANAKRKTSDNFFGAPAPLGEVALRRFFLAVGLGLFDFIFTLLYFEKDFLSEAGRR